VPGEPCFLEPQVAIHTTASASRYHNPLVVARIRQMLQGLASGRKVVAGCVHAQQGHAADAAHAPHENRETVMHICASTASCLTKCLKQM
jgi:alkanesulfonate monooxygenase SsuD/methylene tetrahydromethanopterin reductase-like flavin-dependent oxidoreductase (luciferase family)